MGYIGNQITTVFPTSISVDSATIKGDTTIGDASASDKKILFDGNAQDFHIGLDDSSDSLTIGLGSALGTTSHMVIDANGHVTKPLQPAFLAKLSSEQGNLSNSSSHVTLQFATEIFDQNDDYNNSTYIFTAPVTGRYQLSFAIYLQQIDSGSNFFYVTLRTSNRDLFFIVDPNFSADLDYYYSTGSILSDMDANDTAYVTFVQSGGTAQVDANASSYFSGFLAC